MGGFWVPKVTIGLTSAKRQPAEYVHSKGEVRCFNYLTAPGESFKEGSLLRGFICRTTKDDKVTPASQGEQFRKFTGGKVPKQG